MDIVLEVVDYYFADQAYAALLPLTTSDLDHLHVNYTHMKPRTSSWEYTPSTHLFYLDPTRAAYESIWDRDNVYRQALSLFLITW